MLFDTKSNRDQYSHTGSQQMCPAALGKVTFITDVRRDRCPDTWTVPVSGLGLNLPFCRAARGSRVIHPRASPLSREKPVSSAKHRQRGLGETQTFIKPAIFC